MPHRSLVAILTHPCAARYSKNRRRITVLTLGWGRARARGRPSSEVERWQVRPPLRSLRL